ncbi:MAG: phosphate signaling complex protein PhoU [Synechococcales bacterium]|nr:phosphate signaling complex protein PhoU [Synechococcales bacterium]
MTEPEPLRVNFDRQLKRVQRDVLRMGALVENSCYLARQAMFERVLESAELIRIQDREIDNLYKQIELDCVNLIALQSPVAQDLRMLSAMMQLVRDLERIGDYAKNLGDVAIRLFPYEDLPHLDQIRLMFDRCRAMLAMSLAALADLDAKSAQEMKIKDDAIDSDYDKLYTLLTQKTEVQGVIEPIVLLVLAIRHLERMADHATNIGKRVSYIVTGNR